MIFRAGETSGLVVLPTGLWKRLVFSNLDPADCVSAGNAALGYSNCDHGCDIPIWHMEWSRARPVRECKVYSD